MLLYTLKISRKSHTSNHCCFYWVGIDSEKAGDEMSGLWDTKIEITFHSSTLY